MITIEGQKCKTQTDAVLVHLKSGKQLTQEDAYELVGTQRLGAIIFNLRKMGYDIYSINVKGFNRFGNSTNFVKYHLMSTKEQCEYIERK
tara:strand:+ start:1221 stop:1490 length:270 start_codon:yes stop_codon:yes gene_type:complete